MFCSNNKERKRFMSAVGGELARGQDEDEKKEGKDTERVDIILILCCWCAGGNAQRLKEKSKE